MFSLRSVGIAIALVVSFPAFADDFDKVISLLDGGAAPADVVKWINESKTTFLPRQVYTLIDREAPPDVIKAAASKAAIFYNGSQKSLSAIAKETYATIPQEKISSKSDFTKFFALFDDVKQKMDGIKAKYPDLTKNPGESEPAFDKRVRAQDELKARELAPFEGRIRNTTFEFELPASLGAYDGSGCYQPATVNFSLDAIAFQSWRNAMGGSNSTLAVKLDTRGQLNVASVQFVGTSPRHLEATSKLLCPYEAPESLKSQGVKLKLELKRTEKGQDWNGTAQFVSATTSEKIDARR